MKTIKWFIQNGLLAKDEFSKFLADKFIKKARNNLMTMGVLQDIEENKVVRKLLKIPEHYSSKEWELCVVRERVWLGL